jgi:hypothetical protein
VHSAVSCTLFLFQTTQRSGVLKGKDFGGKVCKFTFFGFWLPKAVLEIGSLGQLFFLFFY